MSIKIASLFAELGLKKEGFDKGLKDSKTELTGFAGGIKKGIGNLAAMAGGAAIAGVAISKFTQFMKQSVTAAGEAQAAQAQVEAVLRSTGQAAGLTMKDIENYSGTLQNLSGIEDDYFMKMSAVMLTFTRITKDSFLEATTAALDMSTALGTDMQSSVIMVGKALNVAAGDVNGASMAMSAMKRVGVAFTTDQIELAKKLIETGDAAGYQKLILQELNVEFGGSAVARMNTYIGKQQALQSAWGNMKEAIGKGLIPELESLYVWLTKIINVQTENIEEQNKNNIAVDYAIKLIAGESTALTHNSFYWLLHKKALDEARDSYSKIDYMANNVKDDLYSLEPGFIAAGKAASDMAEDVDTAALSIEKMNYVIDYSETAFKKQAVAALIAKASLDGFIDPQEEQYIYGMATALGVLTQQEIDAALKAFEFQNTMLAIMDLPAEIQKKFILNIEMYGWEAAQAFMNGMGQNEAQQNQGGGGGSQQGSQQGQRGTTTTTKKITQMRAGGGGFKGWAMVGDSKGGGMTPYTEWVYAPHGAVVYNQSQMAGKSAPPMAGGGVIPPMDFGTEINISQQSVRDLADALFYKLQAVM